MRKQLAWLGHLGALHVYDCGGKSGGDRVETDLVKNSLRAPIFFQGEQFLDGLKFGAQGKKWESPGVLQFLISTW